MAAQAGLSLSWSQTPKTGFLVTRLSCLCNSVHVLLLIILGVVFRIAALWFQSARKWAATWQNQQCDCASSKDSDQHGHPPSLIRVFAVRMKKAWVLSYPLSAQRRLWSDWEMPRLIWVFTGCTLNLLVWSCPGSNVLCTIMKSNWSMTTVDESGKLEQAIT